MTRFEHHVTRHADITCGPAGPPGTHEIRIVDGDLVTVVLRFGSAEQLAAFALVPYGYAVTQRRSAGGPVVLSGEGGNAESARALPADPTYRVGDPDPTPGFSATTCAAEYPGNEEELAGMVCTWPKGHDREHVAGDGTWIITAWPQSTQDGGA